MKIWKQNQMVCGRHKVQSNFGKNFVLLIIYKSSHGFGREYSTRYQSGLDLVLKEISFSIVSIP